MERATSLLRDWELLQRKVVPALLGLSRPRSWTVGPAEDAAALALAYHHAHPRPEEADIRFFLSACSRPAGRVHFALGDVRCLPRSERPAGLRHEDRRWVPDRRVIERVVLAPPLGPVDLLTATQRVDPAAFTHLRKGGHLLFAERPEKGSLPAEVERVDRAGRLFRKTSPARVERTAPDREPPPTLACHQEQRRLVETHYNLARSLARRFSHHGEMADDLEQVALLALVKAAGRYSPERGSSFATFATASILGELKRHFRDKTWMLRVPRSLQEAYLSVKAAREELGQTLGTSPTVQQIAEHLGVSDETVLAAMEAGDSYWPASLDTPRNGDEDSTTDVPVVDSGFETTLDRRQLRDSLPLLEEREKLVLKRLFFDGWTQRDVASEIGVSQMQVSRLMARTLAKLRQSFEVK